MAAEERFGDGGEADSGAGEGSEAGEAGKMAWGAHVDGGGGDGRGIFRVKLKLSWGLNSVVVVVVVAGIRVG